MSLAFWLSELCDASIIIIEKENRIASHTSSRNTGVVHRPFYLNPQKKRVFARSAQKSYFLWSKLASRYGLPWEQRGTLEVALREKDLETLAQYKEWAIQNGMSEDEVDVMDSNEVKRLEPEVQCRGAIFSKTDTCVDYGIFSNLVFELAKKNGVKLVLGSGVERIAETSSGLDISLVDGASSKISCDYAINAAGGRALDIAHMVNVAEEYADLHFRGEYWVVGEPLSSKVTHNIYSIARYKDFPFLDPHFIVRSNGRREIGPNAVLVSGPEAYRGLSRTKSELLGKFFERPLAPKFNLFTSRKFLSLVWSEWRSSISKGAMCERVRRFIPSLDVGMLKERGLAGVRTSLISKEGFVPEALLLEGKHSLHVLNYTSPGATGAPAFSAYIVKMLHEGGYVNLNKRAQTGDGAPVWDYEDAISIFSEKITNGRLTK